MKIKLFFSFYLLLSLLCPAQEKHIPMPGQKALDIKEEPSFHSIKLTNDDLTKSHIAKLSNKSKLSVEQITALKQEVIKPFHQVFDILPFVKKRFPLTPLHSDAWIVYNATTENVHFFTKLANKLRLNHYFSSSDRYPSQLAITLKIITVKRPKIMPKVWTMKLLNAQQPKERICFSTITKPGELAVMKQANEHKDKYTNKAIIESTIGEGYAFIDTHITLELASTPDKKGLILKSYLTTATDKALICPIGISTDPEHIDLLYLKCDLMLIDN